MSDFVLNVTTTDSDLDTDIVVNHAPGDPAWSWSSRPTFREGEPGEEVYGNQDDSAKITCNGIAVERPTGSGGSNRAATISGQPYLIGPVTFTLRVEAKAEEPLVCLRNYTINAYGPRKPYELFFVLDRSGSMSTSDGKVGKEVMSRWDALVQRSAAIHSPALDLRHLKSKFGAQLFATGLEDWAEVPPSAA